MKKTLKRELKLFEIVESDAFVVSVCLTSLISFWCGGKRLRPPLFTLDKVKSGIAGWRQLKRI